jgi:hypothetical protein
MRTYSIGEAISSISSLSLRPSDSSGGWGTKEDARPHADAVVARPASRES